MTSREACAHKIAVISRELHCAVLRLEEALTPVVFEQVVASTFSIGSNWLESNGRDGTEYKNQFLRFARGSAYEAAFQLECIGESVLAEMAHEACALLDDLLKPKPVDIEAALDDAARFPPRGRSS